jgi:23S rRNA (cytidine1920-2'-O)/16S rRNA (cytidine1409-2'-O)-methyltransferase
MMAVKKERIDLLLVARGLAESRNRAQRLVMAGEVRVNGEMIHKSSTKVEPDAEIKVLQRPRYVSRGGKKLAGALKAFSVDPTGKVCADVGASTGGFTDCLLQHGASRVIAIDVGYGLLHWRLRQDARVMVMERTNARYLEELPEKVDLVTVDASFISLNLLLSAIRGWFRNDDGQVIALIKPQFEAGRKAAAVHAGVIKDDAVHVRVLQKILHESRTLGYDPVDMVASSIKGPKGNVEFLVDLRLTSKSDPMEDPLLIDRALKTIPN